MDKLTHEQIWSAIDRLALQTGYSVSGLAKRAGLDPTTFNKSKRFTSGGRERWPSTESIAKILRCTDTSVQDFMEALTLSTVTEPSKSVDYRSVAQRSVPLIGFARAGAGGFFDDGGFPVGQGWDEIAPPGNVIENSYALKVSGDSMMPLYREGDILVIDPNAVVHRGDRVVVKTNEGEVLAKTLERQTPEAVALKSLNPAHSDLIYPLDEIDWIARIVWASQ